MPPSDPERSLDQDGAARRSLLKCMAWAGTGLVWTLGGGVASSALVTDAAAKTKATGLTFVQISDSHIGFKKPANPDPLSTLREAIAKIRALPVQPSFVLHTGDITHLATPEQFDIAQAALSELSLPIHFVPGEHDIEGGNNPQPYLDRFGAGSKGEGWYSFDAGGAHFVGLVNVVHLADRGLGSLGEAQTAWLKDDLAALADSTPIILFAHFPLWALYPDWGWGTADSEAALVLLRRFGSVTVLNGHIHQLMQKVEGNVTFHTARSTAFPQPAPGTVPSPGPKVVPAGELSKWLGVREVAYAPTQTSLAVTDTDLN